MHDADWRRPNRRRTAAGLIAALLMQALWLWLLHVERAPGAPTERRVAVVRLLPAQTRAQDPAHAPAAQQPTERPHRTDAAPADPAAAPGAAVDPRADARPDPETVRPAGPSGEARSTLNLALPRGRAASDPVMARQVRDDPRSHSERRTLEWTIADGAGTLPVDDQPSTSGSGGRIVRQGSKCTRVYDSRIAALNPMDATLKGIPPSVGNCFN